MNEDPEPILDSCLDELLGSQHPPDLSQRILAELDRRNRAGESAVTPSPDNLLPPAITATSKSSEISIRKRTQHSSKSTKGNRNTLVWTSIALSIAFIATFSVRRMAERQAADRTADPMASGPNRPGVRMQATDSSTREKGRTEIAPRPSKLDPPAHAIVELPENKPEKQSEPIPNSAGSQGNTPLLAAAPTPEPLPNDKMVERINGALREHWSNSGLTIPSMVSNAEWQQRVFRVLLGREPIAREVEQFKPHSAASRQELVHSLMTNEPFLEEFARHWSEILTNTFLSSDLLVPGSKARREGMSQYFRRALLEQKSFDRVATELLTAKGSGVPGDDSYDGATNFLLARVGGKLEHATSDAARLFLGRNVECQQCHANPSDGSRGQQEFWELNSFFRQLAAVNGEDPAKPPQLSDVDFLGEDRGDGHEAIVFYELPDGLLKGAYPAFPGQDPLPKSGLVSELNRRELLARCIVNSTNFRQALTNRLVEAVWGRGLVPVDEIDSGESVHRELLSELADQFAAHRFDPRRVIAWAALSDPLTVPQAEPNSVAASATASAFLRFKPPGPGRQKPIQESLLAAARDFGRLGTNPTAAAKVDETSKSVSKSAKSIIEPHSSQQSLFSDVTVPVMDPVAQRILQNAKLSSRQKAEHLFQLVLHRAPRNSELDIVNRLIEQSGDRPETAWQVLWTALQQPSNN